MSKVIQFVVFCFALFFTSIVFGFSSAPSNLIYFPHVVSSAAWETEIGIVNVGNVQIDGTLYGYDNAGTLVESKAITIAAKGRTSLITGNEFKNYSQISNMKFLTENGLCSGYEKFYNANNRVAVPAVSEVNSGDIYVSHIVSDRNWWTGLALLNITDAVKNMTITFNDGSEYPLTLSAGQHWAGAISSFPGINSTAIESAVISNGSGVIGLEIFCSSSGASHQYLSGVLLSDETATSLYYPHIGGSALWWTGIVAYNPNDTSVTMTISPYDAEGNLLAVSTADIATGGKYIGSTADLSLPEETQWFKVDASFPITGLELFGTNNGNQLAGYSTVNINAKTGTFVKVEDNGWTGIAFVNINPSPALVTLAALNNAGSTLTTTTLNLAGNSKQLDVAKNFFTNDITGANYIKFTADLNIVGFQLNGSADGLLLDGLPGLNANTGNPGIFNTDSATLTHLYHPMSEGDRFVYAGYGSFKGEKHTIEAVAKEEVDGVACLKVHYVEFVDKEDQEDYWDLWLAQGALGNIWLLKYYDDEDGSGKTFGAQGAVLWKPAKFKEGMMLDSDDIVISTSRTISLSTDLGPYEDCVVVKGDDTECFAPGIGMVRDAWDDSSQTNGWDLEGYDTGHGSGGTYATGQVVWWEYDGFNDDSFNTDIWYSVNSESPSETGKRLYLNYAGDDNIWIGTVSGVNGIQADLEISSNTAGNDNSDIQVGLAVLGDDSFCYSFIFELSSSVNTDKAEIEIAIYDDGDEPKYQYSVSRIADYNLEYSFSMIFNGDNVEFYVDGKLAHEVDISAYDINATDDLFPIIGCWSKYEHSPAVGYVDNVQLTGTPPPPPHKNIDFVVD